MKKLIILLSFLCIRQTKAQTYVVIPDANFVNYLYTLVPTAMSGNLLNITSPLVIAVTQTINVYHHGISNLSGIQYFLSLTYLDCSFNFSLTTLPALPNSLQSLYCEGNNHMTSLPSLPNSLTRLVCNGDSLTDLPALPNSLTYLDCGFNHLTTLSTLPNSLQNLTCYNNSLTSLPVLPNSLQSLICNNNNITCFPVFPNLISAINLNPNPFTCLPNYILPAMNAYTTTPLCAPSNTNGCAFVGIKELNASNKDISIYPNPANGEFIVETISTEKQMMQLFDLNGKLVLSENISGKTTIDVSNLNEGVYNLTLKSGEGIINKKLVIVR